ncbi:GlsB/YeaQ/YmgE family stress response membrane protein [Myxococcaceae bacterium GXIMD 01537]
MGICTWLVLGGIAGWLASIIKGANAKMGLFANIFVGIIGALVGGWVFSLLGGTGVTGLNIYSVLVATVGAVILLTITKAIWK